MQRPLAVQKLAISLIAERRLSLESVTLLLCPHDFVGNFNMMHRIVRLLRTCELHSSHLLYNKENCSRTGGGLKEMGNIAGRIRSPTLLYSTQCVLSVQRSCQWLVNLVLVSDKIKLLRRHRGLSSARDWVSANTKQIKPQSKGRWQHYAMRAWIAV
jgi:hypothetical protein